VLGGVALPGEAIGAGWPRCQRDFESGSALLRSEASFDLYHGLAWLGGAGGVTLLGDPDRRWSSRNAFDEAIRAGLRLGGRSQREAANLSSDVLLGVATAVLPSASIGRHFLATGDCVETWDMFTDAVESYGLTLFVTQSIKRAFGRERPYVRSCDNAPPRDANCGGQDRNRSFFSGHSSLAAAGAGLTCAYAIERRAWGSSASARAVPCVLGATTALATGALRITSDRHWGSDVLVGFGVGALIGYFDTWGPLDLLRFGTREAPGQGGFRGMILPMAAGDSLGARVAIVF